MDFKEILRDVVENDKYIENLEEKVAAQTALIESFKKELAAQKQELAAKKQELATQKKLTKEAEEREQKAISEKAIISSVSGWHIGPTLRW